MTYLMVTVVLKDVLSIGILLVASTHALCTQDQILGGSVLWMLSCPPYDSLMVEQDKVYLSSFH